MDGQGTTGQKTATRDAVVAARPHEGVPMGWKNFCDEDRPMLSPEQTMRCEPTPAMISYQWSSRPGAQDETGEPAVRSIAPRGQVWEHWGPQPREERVHMKLIKRIIRRRPSSSPGYYAYPTV